MIINVIGAGLAGCEAACYLAKRGYTVNLFEMKTIKKSPAHKMDTFAELVCSNSLKASRIDSAAGLLKWEMEQLGSVCVEAAKQCAVPAGGALAVERNDFSRLVTEKVKSFENINICHQEVADIDPSALTIIATGPLTDGQLSESIKTLCGTEYLNFYDAAAPIITADSVDMSVAFFASRYDKGDGDDYINCPFDKEQYETFYNALISAEGAPIHEFDKKIKVYEGCMPIEVLAKRGVDSIRFGPMKPVGLRNPNTGHRPWAVVQLRKENAEGTMYNMVGFQSNLKFGEQKKVFSLIPGLQNAEFVRYAVMHRNSFINSPKLLNNDFSLKNHPNVYFAGQISGVEGYMESAASGILAAMGVVAKIQSTERTNFPEYTMLGALNAYISNSFITDFQPMGANFGILPPLSEKIKDKKQRYMALAKRSIEWYERLKENNL